MEAVAKIAAEGSYEGHRADFVDGAMFSLEEMYLTVAAFSDVAPWTSDYTGSQVFYQSLRGAREDFLTDPRLPVALGHRLVLVLPAVRGAEPGGPQAVAAPLPEVRRVPRAGRLRPAARPVPETGRAPRAAAA